MNRFETEFQKNQVLLVGFVRETNIVGEVKRYLEAQRRELTDECAEPVQFFPSPANAFYFTLGTLNPVLKEAFGEKRGAAIAHVAARSAGFYAATIESINNPARAKQYDEQRVPSEVYHAIIELIRGWRHILVLNAKRQGTRSGDIVLDGLFLPTIKVSKNFLVGFPDVSDWTKVFVNATLHLALYESARVRLWTWVAHRCKEHIGNLHDANPETARFLFHFDQKTIYTICYREDLDRYILRWNPASQED